MPRLLNVQGIVGIAAALALLVLLLVARGETRRWRKQSAQYEQLYRGQQLALARTVAGYRAATDAARAADQANARRVTAEQNAINERIAHDYETRLAAARARAARLQLGARAAAGDPCAGRDAAVPGLPAARCGPAQAARENRLPAADALIATEQAIQLDELIRWVRRQHSIDVNAAPPPAPR